MIYVFPIKPRSWLMRRVMWLPILVQTFALHPALGLRYATGWANAALLAGPNL